DALVVHAAAAATLVECGIPTLARDSRLLRQTAHLEDQRCGGVVVDDDLCVRRVAVVDVAETSADAERVARQSRLTEEPPSDVHLVDALIAHVAVAVQIDPVPV